MTTSTQTTPSYIYITPTNFGTAIATLQTCLTDVQNWMTTNKLKLNPNKTEFTLLGNKSQRKKLTRFVPIEILGSIWHATPAKLTQAAAALTTCVLRVPVYKSSVNKSKAHFHNWLSYDGPLLWNSLPHEVRSAPTVSCFRQRLKTFRMHIHLNLLHPTGLFPWSQSFPSKEYDIGIWPGIVAP